MRTLSSRLVAVAVLLVAVVSISIGATATLILRHQLDARLDDQVQGALDRSRFGGPRPNGDAGQPPPDAGDGSPGADGFGLLYTLHAELTGTPQGTVITPGSQGGVGKRTLSTAALDQLADLPVNGSLHDLDLAAFGSYRVAATRDAQGDVVVAGLPTRDVDDTISNLIWWEVLLVLAGIGVAAGGGLLLVRRQLAPLREVAATAHEVAALPLESGEVDLSPRVREPDEQTEVGQVGSALNTLLAHVESSLTARHRSEQQVRQFVADASHELRTPLSTIRGYAELSRRTPDDAPALSSSLRKVSAEADRMSTLVDDLLLLARLDAGRPLVREPVDLTLMLLEAVGDARVVGPDHRWRIELPDEPVEVVGDEQRLHQVVTNLLNNARRHTPPESTVTVSVTPPEDGRVSVVVADDGPGFVPELVDRAFERFTRGDVSRTRDHDGGPSGPGGGAGLGLSIVAAIVRAHSGEVTLSSRPGDTRVTVLLPA